MTNKKISVKKDKDFFLTMKEPFDLCTRLGISRNLLLSLVQHKQYKTWVSINGKGKKRFISEPSEPLKKVQLELNGFLQQVYSDHLPEMVHGFVACPKGSSLRRTIKTNAEAHCGKAFVINADIRNFFGSIKPLAVQKVLLNAPFQFNEELASAITLLCLNKKRLPTGAPTSPVISNFIFRDADTEINQLAQKYSYTYTRYADDLTFSGDQRPGASFKQELEQILISHGFELNQRKYRVQSKYGRQTVTGLVVNEKVSVKRNYRKQLRAILHDIETNGLATATARHTHMTNPDEKEKAQFLLKIQGRKNWVEGVQTKKLIKL